MSILIDLDNIILDLKNGNIQSSFSHRQDINNIAMDILNTDELSHEQKQNLLKLIDIGNISYENYPSDILPIEDGIYDLLAVKIQTTDYNAFKVGSAPVISNAAECINANIDSESIKIPFTIPTANDNSKMNDFMFPEVLSMNRDMMGTDFMVDPFTIGLTENTVNKRLRNTAHSYPELVGTLEKCKFVLDKQAIDAGRYLDDNVKIFERDFMVPIIKNQLINMNSSIDMIGTLKYDGVSVEGDVNDILIGARSRGDTDEDEATDLTPILQGYRFPNAPKLDHNIGMKFEAIITRSDLARVNSILGTKYINGRTAIIGIMGRLDAYKYRDFITLVPIQVDFNDGGQTHLNRIDEILFLNKYYSTKEYIRYVVFEGQFTSIMYQIKRYVEEAEFARQFMPFMYDGVVLEFVDDIIRKALGRKNHINQYAMAIKFNPLKKQTIFRGFKYTVGKNGLITPMVYYDPVEFLGSIHTHSTGSSFDRFQRMGLHLGDILDVEYTNDVMPYVTKPDNEFNNNNATATKLEEFPTICPSCGTVLEYSSSGKSAKCPNPKCPEAHLKRLAGMMKSLKLVGFADSSIEQLPDISSMKQLMESGIDDFSILGPTNKITLYNLIQGMKSKPLSDYKMMEALGFSDIAGKTWKKILSEISLLDIYKQYHSDNNVLRSVLVNIRGIGTVTADTIVSEFEMYDDDIKYMIEHSLYVPTVLGSEESSIQIRFTGFRDAELEELLQSKGLDADGNSGVTKKTTILLVPYAGHTSTKIDKARKNGTTIIPVKEFVSNMSMYLPDII